MMASVRIQDLVKLYGSLRAVDGVSLAVEEGEFFALLGPSGCGKTTTLRCIAGLERPSQGEIIIGAQPVTHLPAFERPCGMVFQSYALFPHLSVFDNVAYGLQARRYRQGGPVRKAAVLGSFLSQRAFPLDVGQFARPMMCYRGPSPNLIKFCHESKRLLPVSTT